MADKGAGNCILPVSRIRTIMKSSPEVSNISQESLFLITKATELFVAHLAKKTVKNSSDGNSLEYSVLADLVDEEETLQFLMDIIPQKMTYKEFKDMMAREKKKDNNDDS